MDDFLKELKELIEQMEGVTPEWIADTEKRIDDIVRILPSDISTALAIISLAIDRYAYKQHLRSSEVWKVLTEVSAEVHKDHGDYGE